MMALRKLLGLGQMAVRTVAWRDDGSDDRAIVLKAIRIIVLRRMTIHAADAFFCVAAVLPMDNNAGVGLSVAVHALLRTGRNNNVWFPQASLFLFSSHLHPLDKHQGQQKQSTQRPNNESLVR